MWQGPQSGLLFNSGKTKNQSYNFRSSCIYIKETHVPLVIDWPYPLQYVNVSFEDMALTHRHQYMMVGKQRKWQIWGKQICRGGHQKILFSVFCWIELKGKGVKNYIFSILLNWKGRTSKVMFSGVSVFCQAHLLPRSPCLDHHHSCLCRCRWSSPFHLVFSWILCVIECFCALCFPDCCAFNGMLPRFYIPRKRKICWKENGCICHGPRWGLPSVQKLQVCLIGNQLSLVLISHFL